MKVLGTSIGNTIRSIKSDFKEYHRKDNIFPDDKLEKKANIARAGLLALACIAAAGICMHRGKKHEFPKILYEKFIKNASFNHGVASYKGKLFSGDILNYTKDGFVTSIGYIDGKLRDVHVFNTAGASPTFLKKKYVRDPISGVIRRIHTRTKGEFNTHIFEKGGRKIFLVDNSIVQLVEPLENNRVRISHFKDGVKVNVQILDKKI